MANPEQRLRIRCIRYAQMCGWLHIRLHFAAGTAAGWPDDLFLRGNGTRHPQTVWVEFKAPGKPLRPLQRERLQEIRALGYAATRCDNFDTFKEFMSLVP